VGAPGKYLRKNFPGLYFFLTGLINAFKNIVRPYSIYITDSLGGSFKEYMSGSGMSQRITELKAGLDRESAGTVEVIIERVMHYPDERDKCRISRRKDIAGGILPVEQEARKKLIREEISITKQKLNFPSKHIEESVFYFYHGLRLLPDAVKEYIRDRDFIDAGAFTGDSAIALNNYGYRKIYSIEMSLKSITKYKTYLAVNNIPVDRYEVINAGLSSGDNEPPARLWDTGSSGLSFLRKSGKYDEITVEKRSLDFLVEKYNISPRFIKADIEGNSLEFVEGAAGTLVKFRPVISVAIYHNPIEFFEVKPFLQSLLKDYVFLIRKLACGVRNNLIHSEVILLGYPKEIIRLNH